MCVRPTPGVKLRGPERSEGHVSFNSLVGLPLGFLALRRPRLSERTHRTPGDSSTPVSSQTAGCSESPPSAGNHSSPPAPPSRSCQSPCNPVLSDSAPFRRGILPLEAASQDLGKHLRAPQRGTTRACGYPSRSFAPGVAVVEIHEGAGASHCGGGHPPRRAHGSVGTTPSSAETAGTRDTLRRVLGTMIANALSLESTGSHASAGTTPSKRHGTGTSSFAGGSRTSPGRCAAVLPSTRSESRPSSESTNSPAAAVYWSACAAATATRALLPALHDSDAHRSSFAAHLRTTIDAKTSRRGMPQSRPSGGTNVVGLELRRLRRRSAVGCLSQRPASVRTFDVTIACLKEARHDDVQAAAAR
jgi:hypothetical protein